MSEHAAAINVGHQQRRGVHQAREAEIHDIPLAQVHLSHAARALHHDVIVRGRQAVETLQRAFADKGHVLVIFAGGQRLPHLALNHHLGRRIRFGLQQNGIHVGDRVHPAGLGLGRLGAPNLPAVGRGKRIIRHILRLKWRDAQSPIP